MRFSDIRYIVNEEKRTVVAILEDCEDEAYKDIIRYGYYDNQSLSTRPQYRRLNMPEIIRGVAKCHPEDTFSVEEGKRVAKRKLIKTYSKLKRNIIMQHIHDLDTLRDRLVYHVNNLQEKELTDK